MMTPLYILDAWLLAGAIRLMNLLGQRFGATVPGMVRGLTIALIVLAVCYWVERGASGESAVWTIMFLALAVPTLLDLSIEADKPFNTIAAVWVFARLAAAIWMMIGLVLWFEWKGVLSDLSYACWVAALYVAACPPAPPKRARRLAMAAG